MEYTATQISQYVITAKRRNDVIQQTSSAAASAVVIARQLEEAGYAVEVLDPMGNQLSPARARDDLRRSVVVRGSTR